MKSDNTVIIVDYDMGNVGSIANMIKKAGGKSLITRNISYIAEAEKLILPGVGAFDNGMKNLTKFGLLPILNKKALKDKIPVLGVCLGMQLMSQKSAEGKKRGLSWIKAKTVRFNFPGRKDLKIPHMGWNYLKIIRENRLLKDLPINPRFYFVHSYHLVCEDKEDISALTDYGSDFISVIRKDNIYGTQFHPEKSHKYGMQIYTNFLKIKC